MHSPTSQPSFIVVDPIRDGIANALWKNVTGTPTIASSRFNFNAQEGLIRADLLGAHVEFALKVPAVPTTGDVREWGLKNLALGNRSKIFFGVVDTAFSTNTYDDNGLVTLSSPVTWQAAWTNVDILFIIDWFEDRVVFSVQVVSTGAKSIVAVHKVDASTPPKPVVGYAPLNPYIKNGNSDNLSSPYILIKSRNTSILLI